MWQGTEQNRHAMLARETHDERARQMFAKDYRKYVMMDVAPSVRAVHDHRVKPTFEAAHGRPFASRAEVREALWEDGILRCSESLQRVSQELLWASVVPVVQRQLDELTQTARSLNDKPHEGSLTLDPSVSAPDYMTGVDIHCMPGNYHADLGGDDVSIGAVFDRGTFLYTLGAMGADNDGIGNALAARIKADHPELKPRRVLDLGCTMGHGTQAIARAFPEAEIHAIDVGGPMLRYAHARAIDMGLPIHWHQKDARDTGFADGHFDLVVSVILFHETSNEAAPAILKEAGRLTAPGGVTAHTDIPNYPANPDLFFQTIVDADSFHNNEPYWGRMHQLDWPAMLVDAGFERDSVTVGPIAPQGFPWFYCAARKAG